MEKINSEGFSGGPLLVGGWGPLKSGPAPGTFQRLMDLTMCIVWAQQY